VNRRVVSLLPSATEIVCVLGCGSQLVGRSHECDFPAEVTSLPACTQPNFDASASSSEIERQVKALSQKNPSLYRLDTALLKELRPDLIITQGQCEVCAVSLAEVELAVSRWSAPPQIVSLAPLRLADVWNDIRAVARALGIAEHGKQVQAKLKTRCVDIIEKAVAVKHRPSVACLEWLDPLMAAGNWMPDLVQLAGGEDLLGEPGKHSPWLEWEALIQRDPDVIVVLPCGFDLKRTRAELPTLGDRPAWPQLRAVKSARVFLADGSQFFNRPGPRLVESLEILAEILHPELFRFGHQGTGWERL
jgi:iron complex transport system substrate-binding protein